MPFLVLVSLLVFLANSHLRAHDGDDHGGAGEAGEGCSPIPFPYLPPFMDALPIPLVASPTRYVTNYCVPIATNLCVDGVTPVYEMPMIQFPHRFHRLLPEVDVWGYDGRYPGPTIEAEVNKPLLVHWTNALPEVYPDWLLANTTLHGVHNQSVQTVVHLHGAAVLPRYDGYPTNFFASGSSDEYFYSNIDFNGDGETLWYHDHALGRTANNVYAGLAGFYLLRNRELEAQLKLPSGDYEIPLAIQDRDIQLNCAPATLYTGNTATNGGLPWHYHAVVNGIITPYLEVEPTRYRFRILNGAPFRTFGLHLAATDLNGASINTAITPPPFTVIGTESGYLPSPTNVVSTLGTPGIRMMPGERIDVVIDFTSYAGTNLTLLNQVGNGNVPFGPFLTNIMQFRVSAIPAAVTNPPPPTKLAPSWTPTSNMVVQVVRTNQITLDFQDDGGGLYPGLPFNPDPDGPGYFALVNMEPFEVDVNDFPVAGDTEMWEIINLTGESHPIHIHLLDFRIVNRQRLSSGGTNTWNGNRTNPPAMVVQYVQDRTNHVLKPLGNYLSTNASELNFAQPFESGPKDVVHAAPYAVTRIVMSWPTNEIFYSTPSARSGDPATNGRYIYHCHILDHEDNDMMRPLQLLSPATQGVEWISRAQAHGLGGPPVGDPFRVGRALRLRTQPGVGYELQWTPELEPSAWQSSARFIGSGAPVDIELPPSAGPSGFLWLQPVSFPRF